MNISVACIIYKDKKVLIAHRNPTGDMGNRWEFPGGKVENNEECEVTIKRELLEEFGVESKVGKKITSSVFYHNEKQVLLNAYFVEVEHDGIKKPFVLTEHSEYKWVNIEDIPKDNFVDSDLQIYEEVKTYLNSLK